MIAPKAVVQSIAVLLALGLLTAWRGIELHGQRAAWNAYQAECQPLEANDRNVRGRCPECRSVIGSLTPDPGLRGT